MLISEIFSSIDGEARRAGELATFVRTVGCNLRCKYCDSKYTWEKDETSKEMTIDEIVKECIKLGNHNITFTGGEPLIQKDADALITALTCLGFDVSVETDGAVDFTMKPWFLMKSPNAWVCVDYKCYASGMTDRMLPFEKFARLRDYDVIKCVVGSKEDLELAYNLYKEVRSKGCNCYFYLSPVFGQIEGSEIVDFMKEKQMQGKVRVQLQLHKYFWDPEKRAV